MKHPLWLCILDSLHVSSFYTFTYLLIVLVVFGLPGLGLNLQLAMWESSSSPAMPPASSIVFKYVLVLNANALLYIT